MVEYSQTGNLTKNSGGYRFFYDRTNQLTRIEDSSNNAVASYAYDALGRRIERVDEKASATLRFYYTGQRVIEDTDASGGGAVQRHYIWGNYIDELLLLRDVAGVGGTTNEDLVVLRDERFSPTALVKRSDGSIVERYEHDTFGKTNFLNADFTAKGTQQSSCGLRYTYTGRELDILDNGSFTIMNFRGRYYDPATGAFYQRDPLGYPDGMNAYAGYFAMWNWLDPWGLQFGGDDTGWLNGGGDLLTRTTKQINQSVQNLGSRTEKSIGGITTGGMPNEIPSNGSQLGGNATTSLPITPQQLINNINTNGQIPPEIKQAIDNIAKIQSLLPRSLLKDKLKEELRKAAASATGDCSWADGKDPQKEKLIDKSADAIIDAAAKTGSYTNEHESGKKYHGKGGEDRAVKSANDKENEHADPVKKTDWTPAANDREAFKDEARRIERDGGPNPDKNYNKINSPGKKYIEQDE